MLEQASLRISEEMPPPLALFQAATGYWASQAIYVAAKLGIADLLKEGPSTCGDLAKATATHPPSLSRLMHALTSLGVFAAEEDHRFALTPIGRSLQSGVPGSMRAMCLPWVRNITTPGGISFTASALASRPSRVPEPPRRSLARWLASQGSRGGAAQVRVWV